jgi:hypothetical protein
VSSVLVAWLAYPAIVLVLSYGLGAGLERVVRLPFGLALRMVAGFSALVALGGFALFGPAAAVAVQVLLVLAALAGIAVAVRGRAARGRPSGDDVAPLLGGLAAALTVAAPFALSGRAAFGGFGSLGDGGFQMIGAQLLPRIGATTSGLEPSAITRVMDQYFGIGYPSGALTAIGIPSQWLGAHPSETYQPYLALTVAVAAVAAAILVRQSGMGRGWWLAPVAFVAGAAPLTAAFALQGSVKEVSGAAQFLVFAATVAWAWPHVLAGHRRAGIPVGIAVAAIIAVLGPGAGPLMLAAASVLAVVIVVLAVRGGFSRRAWTAVAVATAVAVVAGLPSVLASLDIAGVASGVLTTKLELGNLPGALPWWKPLGAWFAYDYRFRSQLLEDTTTWVSVSLVIALGLVATAVAVRRRSWVFLATVVAAVVSCWYIVLIGSPWAAGKAMSISAAALWAAAAATGSYLALRGRRGLGAVVLLVLVGLVAGTAAFAYRGVRLSPVDRFAELRSVAKTVNDDRPVLITEFDEFAKAQFVDDRPATMGEGAFLEWRVRTVDDTFPPDATAPPADRLKPADLAPYGWLVVRRGPNGSWPPPSFELAQTTKHYWLFRRTTDRVPSVWRPVGQKRDGSASALTSCRAVRKMGEEGFALVRPRPLQYVLTQHPKFWQPDPGRPWMLDLRGSGFVDQTITVPQAGRYAIWAEGTFNREMTVSVDGQRVGRIPSGATNVIPQSEPVEDGRTVQLTAGTHVLRIARASGGLAPGTARSALEQPANSSPALLGRVALVPAGTPRLVPARSVPCEDGKTAVDWYGRW